MPANAYVALENFEQTLRPYQEDILYDALNFFENEEENENGDPRRFYASPTGTGKGTCQLALLKELRARGHDAWILAPTLGIIRGSLQRCGMPRMDLDALNESQLAEAGRQIYVTTTTRHRNGVLKGEWEMPEVVIYDEAHHAVEDNEVSGLLFAMAPDAYWFGFSATPYRGTPKGSAALKEAWGEAFLVMTIPEAIDQGFMRCPTFEVCPLVDDDTVKVVNGKFQVKGRGGVASKIKTRLEGLVDLVDEVFGLESSRSENSIAITVPNTELCGVLAKALEERGVGAREIVAKTSAKDRARAFHECQQGVSVIVSVAVITEGLDLPWLNVLIDARPTMSPVEFVQRIGRIMRPHDKQARYICVCRNLERHAYLMGGAVPLAAVKEAQEAFPKPTKRAGVRSLGFEALNRFKRIPIPLAGGITGSMFLVHEIDQHGNKQEWAVLTNPLHDKAFVASKYTPIDRSNPEVPVYDSSAKWQRAVMPTDFTGYATSRQTGSLSEGQARWWSKPYGAKKWGLDPDAAETLKRRQFQALPILSDTKHNILTEIQ